MAIRKLLYVKQLRQSMCYPGVYAGLGGDNKQDCQAVDGPPSHFMSHNYYSEINLHVTWHTKESLPLLIAQVQELAHRYLRQKIINAPGADVHEIGATETHIHVAASGPPTLLSSEFVGRLREASSHEVNEQLGAHGKRLQWQAGYGAVRFGTGDLDCARE